MRKTLSGAALLLILLCAAIFNSHYQKRFLGDMLDEAADAEKLVYSGNVEAGLETLYSLLNRWDAWEEYSHVFIRHTDVEEVSSSFYELLSDLCENDTGSARGSFLSLRHSIESIIKMEQPRFGSIF